MGLSNFPSPAEGVLPVLVMNTVMSVAILKNLIRSFLQLMGALSWVSSNLEETQPGNEIYPPNSPCRRIRRGISITQFKHLCDNSKSSISDSKSSISDSNSDSNSKISCSKDKDSIFGGIVEEEGESEEERKGIIECCVCLCKFEDDEEVSELSCKHFFHTKCLDKWFDNHHTTCPLCRSIH